MKPCGKIIISVTGLLALETLVRADLPERTPYEPPTGQQIVQKGADTFVYVCEGEWVPEFIWSRQERQEGTRRLDEDSAFDPVGDWRDQSRPGYRPEPTPQSVEFYRYIMNKAGRGENISTAEAMVIQRMIANRTWPEAPEVTAQQHAMMEWAERKPEDASFLTDPMGWGRSAGQRKTSDAMWAMLTKAGLTEMDTPHTEGTEKFRQYWHSMTEEERRNLPVAQWMRNHLVRHGYDMRSDEQRERDDALEEERALQQAQLEAMREEEELLREEEERGRLEEQEEWFRQAWEREDRIQAERATDWERGWNEFAVEFEQLSPEAREATWAGMDEGQRAELKRRTSPELEFDPEPALVTEEAPADETEQEAQQRIQELARLMEMKTRFQSYLERGTLTLSAEPNPVIPPDDGVQVPLHLEILLGDDRDNLGQVLANWQHVLRLIAGDQVVVSSTFDFSTYSEDVERGDGPYLFRTQSPMAEGYHPLVATVTFTAEGESLTGDYSHLAQTISREVVVPIEVKSALDITEGPAWDTLRSTTEVSINRSGASSLMGTDIAPSRRMTFRHSRTTQHSHMPVGQQFLREEAEIRIVFAMDGESIETLEIDSETYNNETGELTGRMQQRVHNLPGRLTPETEIRAPQAFYSWAREQSTGQSRHDRVRDGERVWQDWHPLNLQRPSRYDVNFTVSREAQQRKWDRERELREQRDAQAEAIRQQAADGDAYAGPFGSAQGMEGTIEINLNRQQKIFGGTFQSTIKPDENTRVTLKGDVQGTFDPETGELTGTIHSGSARVDIYRENRWWPQHPENIRGAPIRGKLEDNTIRGTMFEGAEEHLTWEAEAR